MIEEKLTHEESLELYRIYFAQEMFDTARIPESLKKDYIRNAAYGHGGTVHKDDKGNDIFMQFYYDVDWWFAERMNISRVAENRLYHKYGRPETLKEYQVISKEYFWKMNTGEDTHEYYYLKILKEDYDYRMKYNTSINNKRSNAAINKVAATVLN